MPYSANVEKRKLGFKIYRRLSAIRSHSRFSVVSASFYITAIRQANFYTPVIEIEISRKDEWQGRVFFRPNCKSNSGCKIYQQRTKYFASILLIRGNCTKVIGDLRVIGSKWRQQTWLGSSICQETSNKANSAAISGYEMDIRGMLQQAEPKPNLRNSIHFVFGIQIRYYPNIN